MGSDAESRMEAGKGFSPGEVAAGGEDAESLDGEGVRRSETLRLCFPKEHLCPQLGRRRLGGRAGSKSVPKMSHRQE